jgi:hypothetical protein
MVLRGRKRHLSHVSSIARNDLDGKIEISKGAVFASRRQHLQFNTASSLFEPRAIPNSDSSDASGKKGDLRSLGTPARSIRATLAVARSKILPNGID